MLAKLSRREVGILYGVVVACSVFFFLLGVYFGSTSLAEPPPSETSSDPRLVQEEREQEEEPDLDFYSELLPEAAMKDSDRMQEPPRDSVTGSVEETPAETGGASPVPRQAEPARQPERVAAPDVETPAAPSARYTVQVGAYRTRAEADQLTLRLNARGHSSRIIEPTQTNRFYRVWVGSYESQARAAEAAVGLENDGFDTYVRPDRKGPSD